MDLLTYTKQQGRGAFTRLGQRVGVPPQTIRDWAIGRRATPKDWCPALESATRGAVTCEELRPDAAWCRVADPAWPCDQGRPTLDIANCVPPTAKTSAPSPSPEVQTAHEEPQA